MNWRSTFLDKVVDRSQYVIWRDRRALSAEEIDEHIRDGDKIWDLEFGGTDSRTYVVRIMYDTYNTNTAPRGSRI